VIPRVPFWLGVASALPFVVGAPAVALGPDWLQATAYYHLTNYAALNLAFLGAVLWGFAAASGASGRWFAAAAVPLLAGWISLAAIHPVLRALLLIGGFAAAFALDLAAGKGGIAPRWYVSLRKPLTAVTLVSLGVIAVTAN